MVHDCGPNQSEDGTGWIEIFGAAKAAGAAKNEGGDASSAENEGGSDVSRAGNEGGLLLTINGKTGWREVEIGRGSSALTCPVAMLETWMRLGQVADRRCRVTEKHGRHIERLTDLACRAAFSRFREGFPNNAKASWRLPAILRRALASAAKIEEAHVQRHGSATPVRRK